MPTKQFESCGERPGEVEQSFCDAKYSILIDTAADFTEEIC
jgi:hypothetical protein